MESSAITKTRAQGGDDEKSFTLHQLNPSFYLKIMSRTTDIGSNRISSHRCPIAIPLEWEVQPGKPKDQADPRCAATRSNSTKRKKLKWEKKSMETKSSRTSSGSNEYCGIEFSTSDADEATASTTNSSVASSSSPLPTHRSVVVVPSSRPRIHRVAKGVMKWAAIFRKHVKGTK